MRVAWPALLLLLLFPSVARPQSSPPPSSGKLGSVEVKGSRFASHDIAAAIGMHPGASITKDDLQAGADRLAQLGWFSSVQYRFSSSGAAVQVEYAVTDAPAVAVLFDNFPWFTDDELNAAAKEAAILYDGTAPEHGAILDSISGALEKLIETRGVHAQVTHNLINNPLNGKPLQVFRIDGQVLKVQAVQFSDDLAKNDHAIQQSLESLIGKPFSRNAIELFEFEQVRPIYYSHAFLNVKFERPLARFEGNPNAPLPDKVIALVSVNPGPAFKWGGVTWKGNTVVPSADLDKLIELKPDEVADGNVLEATWGRVRQLYGEMGYLDTTIEPVPQFDAGGDHVSYVVTLTEGPRYHMGNLVLSGLSTEGEKRIRAAWAIAPGAIFNDATYELFLNSGARAAFKGIPFHYEKIGRYLQKDPASGKVDVMLDFQ
jgi:outer membrane protein assembly factor BamA